MIVGAGAAAGLAFVTVMLLTTLTSSLSLVPAVVVPPLEDELLLAEELPELVDSDLAESLLPKKQSVYPKP